MSTAQRQGRPYTPEEYLALERKAAFKSEYLNGDIFAMAGSSPTHDTIVANIGAEVHQQLKGRPCQVFTSNMKVRTGPKGLFSYPDLTVVCGAPRFHDQKQDVLTNPRVVFEVLSPSTEAFDRGKKRVMYQSIESLTDYVMIAQDEPLIDHCVRQEGGRWLVSTLQGLEARLIIDSIVCTLSLRDVYDRIEFSVTDAS